MNKSEIKKEINRIANLDTYAVNGKMVDGWCGKQKKDVKALLKQVDISLPIPAWEPKFERGERNPEPDYSGHYEFEDGQRLYYANPVFFAKIGNVEQTLAVWKRLL